MYHTAVPVSCKQAFISGAFAEPLTDSLRLRTSHQCWMRSFVTTVTLQYHNTVRRISQTGPSQYTKPYETKSGGIIRFILMLYVIVRVTHPGTNWRDEFLRNCHRGGPTTKMVELGRHRRDTLSRGHIAQLSQPHHCRANYELLLLALVWKSVRGGVPSCEFYAASKDTVKSAKLRTV